MPAGAGLEAGRIREGAAARVEAVADFAPARGGDECHRHRSGCATAGDEDGGNRKIRHGFELEHFQEKWNPVFRPKMRQCKNASEASPRTDESCRVPLP